MKIETNQEEVKQIESVIPEGFETLESDVPPKEVKKKKEKKKKDKSGGGFFKKHKKLVVFLCILLVIIIVFLAVGLPKIKASMDAMNVTTQNFETIEKKDISNSVAVTGTVTAKESRTVSTLVSNTKVVSVSVEVGDYVTKGQEICVFDTENIELKMANLEKQMDIAEAKSNESVTNAQVNVNKANTTLANDFVDNTTNVARLQQNYDDAMRDYYNACDGYTDAKNTRDSAKAEYESAEGGYNDAKSKYDALPDAVKAGLSTGASGNEASMATTEQSNIMKNYSYWSQLYNSAKSAYEAAVSKVTQYETNIENAEKQVRQAKQNLDDAAIKTDRTLVSDYTNVASAELSQGTTNIEATATNDDNKERMDDYQSQMEDYVITAPISGVVTSLSVTEGDEFTSSAKTEVCVIQDDTGWIVEGTVDQYDISSIEEGMKAVVKTDATGDDEMEGEVTFVSPVPSTSGTSSSTAQSSSGSSSATNYPVKITLNERDDRIRIGMPAETSIILEQVKDVLVVPYNCINEKEDGTFYITVADESGMPGDREGSEGERPEGKGRPSGTDMAGKPSGIKMGGNSSGNAEVSTRDITVTKGLETDYYTEVISDEVKEGMRVLVPETERSSDNMDFMYGYDMGGPGGDPGDGGPGGF